MEHLGRTNTHHMYTHSVKRWVHLDRVEAERWSILAGHTHTTCTRILSKDESILTESRPKDGASWPDNMYTHSNHLDRIEAERWSILAGQTHTTCTHILSKDGCILTESRPKMEYLGRTNTHHMYTHSVKRWVHLDSRKMEHLGRTNTHHMYTHSVKRWVHLDRVQAERWSILAGHTHTTCTHILSKDGCILTESRPKDGASWPDKHTTCTHILSKDGSILTESRPKDEASWPDTHTPHVHTFCQKMGAS